jgi:hypothetical protein
VDLLDDLLPMDVAGLHGRMAGGHPIRLEALDDTEYHGVSLGLPAWVEGLAWKTFKKVFRREPATGVLRGWNVAVEQQGPRGPFVDRFARGERVTYGHYEVHPGSGYALPRDYRFGAVIDYARGGNRPWEPFFLTKDPLVALTEDGRDVLLGYGIVSLGPMRFNTPAFFLLTRGGPLTYDVKPPWR